MLRLSKNKFLELQGSRTEQEMASLLGISRTQLWRLKTGANEVGSKFLSNFKSCFPDEPLDAYFLIVVPLKRVAYKERGA